MATEESTPATPVIDPKAKPLVNRISQKVVKPKLPPKNKTGLPRRQKKALQKKNNRVAA